MLWIQKARAAGFVILAAALETELARVDRELFLTKK